MELEKKPWAVVLVRWQSHGIDVDGYVLGTDYVRSVIKQRIWSFSKGKKDKSGEWKVNEPKLANLPKCRGIGSLYPAVVKAVKADRG